MRSELKSCSIALTAEMRCQFHSIQGHPESAASAATSSDSQREAVRKPVAVFVTDTLTLSTGFRGCQVNAALIYRNDSSANSLSLEQPAFALSFCILAVLHAEIRRLLPNFLAYTSDRKS